MLRRWRAWWWSLCLLLCLALAGCGATGGQSSVGGASAITPPATTGVARAAATATTAAATPQAAGAQHVQVFVEPAAGETPLLHAIEGAQTSLQVELYLLTDRNVINALEDAAQRGVSVRVLLELHPYGSDVTSPQQTMDELQAAGVQVESANPAFHYTHEKALIVDGATLYVLTANLTKAALGGSSYTTNREYGVIDANSADVQEANAIFQADWTRAPTPPLPDVNLVVAPVNARTDLAAFIASAHVSLIVEDEEMEDSQSEDELIAAAQRGVNVEVALPQPSGSASASPDVARLLAGGVHVRYIVNPYMHAKMLVADGGLGFVGSENFSANSLDDNRELGIFIADPAALATLTQTFQQDWSAAQAA